MVLESFWQYFRCFCLFKESQEKQAALQKRVEELEEGLSKEQKGRKKDSHQAQELHLQLGNLVQQLAGLHQDMAQIL